MNGYEVDIMQERPDQLTKEQLDSMFDIRESVGYAEDFDDIEVTVDPVKVAALTDYTDDIEDIDTSYPTTKELDNMDSFLSHYTGFVDKVDGRLTDTDTIALYAVYINARRD